VEEGDHLFRCLVYTDLNTVRTGIVDPPSQWPSCGYNEIQEPKRKNVLIDYEKLRASLGLESYDLVKSYHRKWVEEYPGNGKKIREDKWSASIAVGSRGFVEAVKSILDGLGKGRRVKEIGEGYQLREPSVPYGDHFGAEKDDIGPKNTYFWNDNIA